MSWQNYILPGDLLATAQEVDSAKISLVRAIEYLLHALSQHNAGDFDKSRKLVNLAVDRLEDWERSDNEMQAAHKRYLDDVRVKRQVELLERLKRQGVHVELISFRRMAQ